MQRDLPNLKKLLTQCRCLLLELWCDKIAEISTAQSRTEFPMQPVYYSHSFREKDRHVNSYFLDRFADHHIHLVVDEQSETWCVPKLEKYVTNAGGMIAVIPQRKTPEGKAHLSPYIRFEIGLARRAGLPLLLFVDDWMLAELGSDFPDQAIPFDSEDPKVDQSAHSRRISEFCDAIHDSPATTASFEPRRVSVFVGDSPESASILDCVMDLFKRNGYRSNVYRASGFTNCLDDVSVIERVMPSEVSIFCLDQQLTVVDLALCTAHALCRPAFRIRYNMSSETSEPCVTGLMQWSQPEQLIPVLDRQILSFKRGCVKSLLTHKPEALLEQLERLQPHGSLDRLMVSVGMPAEIRPSPQLVYGQRCQAVVEWADSSGGCGLAQLQLKLQGRLNPEV